MTDATQIDVRDKDSLSLKWGTMKGWDLKSGKSLAAAEAYLSAGEQSLSAMAQEDSPAQKEALCVLIDCVAENGGVIENDWSGEVMTAEQAKNYVLTYGNR